MKGQLLIDRDTGQRWVRVPDKGFTIGIRRFKPNDGYEGIYVYRDDDYHLNSGDPIPMSAWLENCVSEGGGVEVPDYVVQYAHEWKVQFDAMVARVHERVNAVLAMKPAPPAIRRRPPQSDSLRDLSSEELDVLLEAVMASTMEDLIEKARDS